MWIRRKDYDALVMELAGLRAENREKASTLSAVQTTLDWARVRLSQVEHERAQLLFNYTGVKINTPSIEPERTGPSMREILEQLPSFEDVGDAEARRLGLGWDESGALKTKVE